MPDTAHAIEILGPIIAILGIGVAAALCSRALGLSPIVGYLAAGVAIGPGALGFVEITEETALLAELGVVFLLFDIGLHFSPRHIRESAGDILGLGAVQVSLAALVFGGAAYLLGLSPLYAVVTGLTLALSSTAVVARLIAERSQQNCPVGLTATSILIFQDVVAIFLLILATSLGSEGADLLRDFGTALGKAALAFCVAVLIGRYAARPVFALISRGGHEEVFTAAALFIALLAAVATGAADLSLTLGAFLGGMIVAETAFRPIVQSEIKPFRGLLLGFFFITVGMSIDVALLASRWPEIIGAAFVIVAAKAVLVGVAARPFGWTIPGATQLGFLMAQGSEFGLVILSLAPVRAGLGEEAAAILIAAIALTLATTPSVSDLGRRLAGRLRERSAEDHAREMTRRGGSAPALIVGMGETGRTVADALTAFDIGYTAIERDAGRHAGAVADGYEAAFGDASDPRLWEPIAMSERRAAIVTPARYDTSASVAPIARERYPDLIRFVPVEDAEQVTRFEEIGMSPVVDRSAPRGLDLAAAVLEAFKVEREEIDTWMRRQQERALGTEETARAV